MNMIKAAAIAILALTATPALAQGRDGPGGNPIDRLLEADANHDGSVSRAEAQAARGAMFDRLDADHNGALSEAERTPPGGGQGGPPGGGRMMGNPDANGDGVVSRAEFVAQNRGFDLIDSDNNGVLSPAELDTARQRMANR